MWTYEPTLLCGTLWGVLLRESQAGVVSGYLFVDQRLNTVLRYLGSHIREGYRPNRRPERVRLEHHTTWSFPAGYVDS
jgi:hypothetical protein